MDYKRIPEWIFQDASLSFSCERAKRRFFENDDAIHRISIVLVISCGQAKTIRIRQRILRKYSEAKKKKTLLCQAWKSTGIFKYIFIGHCPDYAHARKTFLSLKRLVTILSLARPPGDLESLFHLPYCFCEGKLLSEVNLWHLTYPPL